MAAVGSILLRWLVDPMQMGIWQGLKLVLNYSTYSNLGISKAAARELTLAHGRGDPESARRSLDLSFSVNTVSSLVYAACAAGVGVVLWARGATPSAWPWAAGLWAVAALVVVNRFVTFKVTMLRAQAEFRATSRLALLEAAVSLAATSLLAWGFGLPGIYAGSAAVLAASLVYLRRCRGLTLTWRWDWREIGRLIAIGGPMLVAGGLGAALRSLDRVMILAYLGDREFQLGCYSLALMAGTQLFGTANLLAMVLAPRFGQLYGRTGEESQVAQLAARHGEFQAVVMFVLGGVAIELGPILLNWLLPAYRPGLESMVRIVPGVIAAGLTLPLSMHLQAVNRPRRAVAVMTVALVLAASGYHVVLTQGWGLAGVAWVGTAAYAVTLVLSAATTLWRFLGSADRIRYALSTGLAVGLLSLLAATRGSSFEAAGLAGTGGLRLALVLLVGTGTFALGCRFGKWADVVSSLSGAAGDVEGEACG
jgi:O-antigen/teichoic acid export membrane protein